MPNRFDTWDLFHRRQFFHRPGGGGVVLRLQWSESRSVMSSSLRPHGLYSPWNSPGWNPGVGSLSLLQGIFPTQGLDPALPHCRRFLYHLSHQGSPITFIAQTFQMQQTSWLGSECKCGLHNLYPDMTMSPEMISQQKPANEWHCWQNPEKAMAPHSSTLAWRIPGTGEPGGLLSTGSHRVGHDWSDLPAANKINVNTESVWPKTPSCYWW